nr:unnamed protein product [Callosobruchus chinensis]
MVCFQRHTSACDLPGNRWPSSLFCFVITTVISVKVLPNLGILPEYQTSTII